MSLSALYVVVVVVAAAAAAVAEEEEETWVGGTVASCLRARPALVRARARVSE